MFLNTWLPGRVRGKVIKVDIRHTRPSKEIMQLSDNRDIAPKAARILFGDDPFLQDDREHHEPEQASSLLSALFVTPVVGRSFLLPSKAMFTPFGIARYASDVVIPVIFLAFVFSVVNFFLQM